MPGQLWIRDLTRLHSGGQQGEDAEECEGILDDGIRPEFGCSGVSEPTAHESYMTVALVFRMS